MGAVVRARRRIQDYICRYGLLILWVGVNMAVFFQAYYQYKLEPKHYYLRTMLGLGLCVSRGTAAMLNVSCCLVLLPVCRCLTTWVNRQCHRVSRRCGTLIIDRAKVLHTACAFTIVLASGVHTVSHVINAVNFSRHYNYEFHNLNLAQFKGQSPLVMILTTVPGVTGLLMLLVLVVMMVTATRVVRAHSYSAFWYTHQLFFVFYVMLMAHPLSGALKEQSNTNIHIPGCRQHLSHMNTTFIQENGSLEADGSFSEPAEAFPEPDQYSPFPEPSDGDPENCKKPPQFVKMKTDTWISVTVALSVYLLDLGCRLLRRQRPAQLVAVVQHPASVVELQLAQPGFSCSPGQYILLRCPQVSALEWHPITVTSCPPARHACFTLHIKKRGDWSNGLHDTLQKSLVSTSRRCSDAELPCQRRTLVSTSRRCGDAELPCQQRRLRAASLRLYVDGPFSSPMEDVLQYSVSVCIAGGIGITPFAAILSYLQKLDSRSSAPRRLHLVWLCRQPEDLLCFAQLLCDVHRKFWHDNWPDRMEIQLYITGNCCPEKRKLVLESRYPFLGPRLRLGKPDWKQTFTDWIETYEGWKVGVFCCGPKSLNQQIQKRCISANRQGASFIYKHEAFS